MSVKIRSIFRDHKTSCVYIIFILDNTYVFRVSKESGLERQNLYIGH